MERSELAHHWNIKAADWDLQVGEEGDANRRLNSDPVLWRLLGETAGQAVLDAGCGTGYLSRQLAARGAIVTGIDISPEMIAIARAKGPESIGYAVDDLTSLETLPDQSFDAIVSNYVLMDLPDLDGAAAALQRVLRPGGRVVLVINHPCFPLDQIERDPEAQSFSFHWSHAYFDERRLEAPPWRHFTSHFVHFHRPLSRYWQAFAAAGLRIDAFEEPVVDAATAAAEGIPPERLWHYRSGPGSVAFCLKK
ncbi:MAG: class I SAM-dependent methyltransferase [Candidatus Sericytochromatia bacterium]